MYVLKNKKEFADSIVYMLLAYKAIIPRPLSLRLLCLYYLHECCDVMPPENPTPARCPLHQIRTLRRKQKRQPPPHKRKAKAILFEYRVERQCFPFAFGYADAHHCPAPHDYSGKLLSIQYFCPKDEIDGVSDSQDMLYLVW